MVIKIRKLDKDTRLIYELFIKSTLKPAMSRQCGSINQGKDFFLIIKGLFYVYNPTKQFLWTGLDAINQLSSSKLIELTDSVHNDRIQSLLNQRGIRHQTYSRNEIHNIVKEVMTRYCPNIQYSLNVSATYRNLL